MREGETCRIKCPRVLSVTPSIKRLNETKNRKAHHNCRPGVLPGKDA